MYGTQELRKVLIALFIVCVICLSSLVILPTGLNRNSFDNFIGRVKGDADISTVQGGATVSAVNGDANSIADDETTANTVKGRVKTSKPSEIEAVPENKTVVYDVDILHTEVFKTHSMLYGNEPTSECILRDPKCVVLGVAKSGTQELVTFASLHPNIILKLGLTPPGMFDKNETIRRRNMINVKKNPMPCSYADQIVIAKTDTYLFQPEIPHLLQEFNPDLKMILIVREPVERMVSGFSFDYLQRVQHKMRFTYKPELVPEMDTWFVNQSNDQAIHSKQLDHSTYYTGLERFLKVFPREQILVLESEEFKSYPVRVLQKVEQFLNLKPIITDAYFTFVKEKGFYCLNKDKIYCFGSDRGRVKMRELRPRTKTTMKSYFKPLNKKFFEMIGETYYDW